MTLLAWLLACAPPAEPGDTGCVTAATWTNFADGFFASYCRSCHAAAAPDRHGAPVGLDFDTEEQARALTQSIRRTVLDVGTMPPGGGLLDDDLVLLGEWLDCRSE